MLKFRPVLGVEEKILNTDPLEGYLYFATDTKKIFYRDSKTNNFIPMGGNFGLYYGKLIHKEVPDEGQEEFDFSFDDLEESEKISTKITSGDLILNIPDGSFYRVVSIDGDLISTKRITISGSGGGGSGPGLSNVGEMTFTRLGEQYITSLYQSSCKIGFRVSAVDASGESTGDGSVKIEINGVEVSELRQRVSQNKDIWIDIGKYLPLGTDIPVKVSVSMDVGGSSNVTQSKKWFISTTQSKLIWNYAETTLNNINEDFLLEWTISGNNIQKTVSITIDGSYPLLEKTTSTQENWNYTINASNLSSYNLNHGVHTFKIDAEINVGGQIIPLESVERNVIFVDSVSNLPIISCLLYSKNLKQYNTIKIPVIIYSKNNVNGTSGNSIYLFEDNVLKGEIKDAENGKHYEFNYTPIVSGDRILTLKYENIDFAFPVEVEDLGIENSEVSNYAFKFQASSFANNDAVQNWTNGNNIRAIFSDGFDWINGGLLSETDENGNSRNFVKIKAGSRMTINYPLFNINAKEKGKTFKIIFKATECRNYDALVLNCKKDKKISSVDVMKEFYLDLEENSTISYSTFLNIDENSNMTLMDPKEATFTTSDENSRKVFSKSFIEYENNIYQCNFGLVEKEKEEDPDEYYAYYYLVNVKDSFDGLFLNAQSAIFNSVNNTISTQYCEDSYIELELDISQYNAITGKNYIKFWIDGVPSGVVVYDSLDSFTSDAEQFITIGSDECDVNIYLMKAYERSLKDEEHLQNFISDAPNAEEMINRFTRNNILDERKEISPSLLATANPNCLVHVYEIPRMTKHKKDPVEGCIYDQYHNSNSVGLHADNVTIKVQGTSSEKYVEAAANIDSDFTEGFIDTETGKRIDGWSMDGGNAIPCNYFCTKVNVASCENANNALNQEWYNLFQPYKSVLKCKNSKARDTMQFTNGVLFLKDKNTTFSLDSNADKKLNNVFGEITGYIQNPYPKFYSLANMGNSKDNVHVFHDTSNPLECCIEIKDNQNPQQWMISNDYDHSDIEKDGHFEFRYPDGIKEVKKLEKGQEMINGWNRLVNWMSTSNPQPRYKKHLITSEKEFKNISYNRKTKKDIPVYVLNSEKTRYDLVEAFDQNINTYYTKTNHINGYTNLKLSEPVPYGNYTFSGFIADKEINPETQKPWQENYTPLIKGCVVSKYNFANYIDKDEAGNVIENYIANENGYTYDTYEYRMAKMLHECEDYLIMDSIVYHYLFIEKHCMIDNVAKNTFWSTEDCKHWNLIKDYDNDTADGNDNQGKFTRTYGMEVLDELNDNVHVFNAYQSVWLNFIHGLFEACEWMYNKLEEKTVTYKNRQLKVWSKNDYLWLFKDWQSSIPERCWIEDYYRKYLRPYELYNNNMFVSMMEGGQKTHQREQFETYQDIYISSKYHGDSNKSSYMLIRSNGKNMLGYQIPVTTYCDCYIRMEHGSNVSTQRVKRNQENYFVCPTDDLGNGTTYFYPARMLSIVGKVDGGQLGDIFPEQLSFSGAGKLRELIFSTEEKDNNVALKNGFSVEGNSLLEKLHVCNLVNYESGLNLKGCPNIKEIKADNSTFTSVEIANNAPVQKISLHEPTSLYLSNLFKLQELNISNYSKLILLNLNNIDNNENINSKNIVDNCQKLEKYKLTNVKWFLNNSEEIDNNLKTIKILERLKNLKTLEVINDQGNVIGEETKANSLTGNLQISSEAYNETDSFDIYSTYAKPELYPNLDIEFNGDKSKLYNVQILNGDGRIYWQKKITSGEKINLDFLSDGPNGKFEVTGIYKASTLETNYNFNNSWSVQIGDTVVQIDSEIPIYELPVNSDIIFTPNFSEELRLYKVEFFDIDGTPLPTFSGDSEFKYGTEIKTLYPGQVPSKSDDNLQLYETYEFKGYGLSPTSKGVVPDDYKIINDSKFYAIFGENKENVHNIITNPFYFEADLNNYIKVKDGYTLKGKITLPKDFNGEPVRGIQSYGFQRQDVTHVFWQPESQVSIEVGAGAFYKITSLKYYEITNNLTTIHQQAFQEVNFEKDMMIIFGENLTSIKSSSFNKSFQNYIKNNPNDYAIHLNGKIREIGNLAFAYNTGPRQKISAHIHIGTEELPWVANLKEDGIFLGENIFDESEKSNSTYSFHIISSISISQWAEDNAEYFKSKLGLRDGTNIQFV